MMAVPPSYNNMARSSSLVSAKFLRHCWCMYVCDYVVRNYLYSPDGMCMCFPFMDTGYYRVAGETSTHASGVTAGAVKKMLYEQIYLGNC